jgi:hypothetical protein
MVPDQVEIYRNANSYKGGGATSIWYRWGYVLAPAGYDWNGSQDKFVSNDEYKSVIEGGTAKIITNASSTAACTGTWTRKVASALSLGILPVFHS